MLKECICMNRVVSLLISIGCLAWVPLNPGEGHLLERVTEKGPTLFRPHYSTFLPSLGRIFKFFVRSRSHFKIFVHSRSQFFRSRALKMGTHIRPRASKMRRRVHSR